MAGQICSIINDIGVHLMSLISQEQASHTSELVIQRSYYHALIN